jgi:hypothetical protein
LENAVETKKGSKQIINNNHNIQNTVTGNYDIHNIIPDNNDKKLLSVQRLANTQ